MQISNGETRTYVGRQTAKKQLVATAASDIQSVVQQIGQSKIDMQQVIHVCGKMQGEYKNICVRCLCPWLGQTWKASTDIWAGVASGRPYNEDSLKCMNEAGDDAMSSYFA